MNALARSLSVASGYVGSILLYSYVGAAKSKQYHAMSHRRLQSITTMDPVSQVTSGLCCDRNVSDVILCLYQSRELGYSMLLGEPRLGRLESPGSDEAVAD